MKVIGHGVSRAGFSFQSNGSPNPMLHMADDTADAILEHKTMSQGTSALLLQVCTRPHRFQHIATPGSAGHAGTA